MIKKQYNQLLNQVMSHEVEISSLNSEILFPHLSAIEVHRLLRSGDTYVACPGVFVKNSYHVLHIYNGAVSYAFGARTIRSYFDGKPHGDIFRSHTYYQKAIDFSASSWGKDLVLDNWDSVGTFIIQDPTRLTKLNYPTTKNLIWCAFSEDVNKIINTHTNQTSEILNNNISVCTDSKLVWSEIRGGRGGYTFYNCANCGGGLGLYKCSSCNHQYEDNNFRAGWNTPLPKKIVELLIESGHVFPIDPQVAQQAELATWKNRQSK